MSALHGIFWNSKIPVLNNRVITNADILFAIFDFCEKLKRTSSTSRTVIVFMSQFYRLQICLRDENMKSNRINKKESNTFHCNNLRGFFSGETSTLFDVYQKKNEYISIGCTDKSGLAIHVSWNWKPHAWLE